MTWSGSSPHQRRRAPALLALGIFVCLSCGGRRTPPDAAPGDEGGRASGAGFEPRLGVAQDGAVVDPHAPTRCGELGQSNATAVAYSPDGALLAVAGAHLRLLSTDDWQEVRQLDGSAFPTESVQRLAFAANGTVLVGMGQGPLGFWRVEDGSFLYSLDFPTIEDRPRWQQVATSQTSLLGLSNGQTVVFWDVEKQTVVGSIAPIQGHVGALALSEKADMLALLEGEIRAADASVLFASARISLWDVGSGRLHRTLSTGDSLAIALALSPDASALATVAQAADCAPPALCDTEVTFHRTSNGQPLGHTSSWKAFPGSLASTGLRYLPGGDLLAVASSTPGLLLIRTADTAVVNIIPDSSGDLAFSPEGKLAIPGGSIEIRTITDGTIVDLVPASTGNRAPTFSPDGQHLASVDGNDVVLWRVTDRAAVQRFTGLGKNVQSLAFSPDGQILASGGKDAIVRMWRIDQSGDPLVVVKQGQPVNSVVFSPDGSTLCTGDSQGNIFLRDSKTGASTNVWYGQGSVNVLAFSPDGKLLASGGALPALRLWEVQTSRTAASASHGAAVTALAFSSDGLFLASAASKANCGNPCYVDDGDLQIKIWRIVGSSLDLEASIPTVPEGWTYPPDGIVPVNAHAAVWGLAFAPDGKTLFTAGPQNAGHLYHLPDGTMAGSFGNLFAGTPFAVSPDATRIVTNSSPIQVWCAAPAGL